MKQKRLVYGVGVNDVPGGSGKLCDGRFQHDPFYTAWHGMLMRCYSEKYQAKYKTYIGCSVCDDWLVFSAFKRWMITQPWENRSLDKDLIQPGNKLYCPELCAFVPEWLNNFTNKNGAARGSTPIGVSYSSTKKNRKFLAQIKSDGKNIGLGYFYNQEDAHRAYLNAKSLEAHKRISRYINEGEFDTRVVSSLKRFADQILSSEAS